jgi:hypothetical protein
MGFPHSEIFGSKCAGNSPKLIAACHVLHRLSVPRHPPNALLALDFICQRTTISRSSFGSFRAGDDPHTQQPCLPFQSHDERDSGDLDFQTSSDERCQRTNSAPSPARRVQCDDGGGRRDRTDDLLLAKQALSQLSYAPVER